MGGSPTEKSGELDVRPEDDIPLQRALSPLSSSRIRFLPRELPAGVKSPSAMSSATMETHILDVESPGATLERKKQGGGIIYFPPENLAEYLDSSLVTPVSGGVSSARRGSSSRGSGRGGRKFFDECAIPEKELPVEEAEDLERSPDFQPSPPSPEVALFYCAFCMRNRPQATRDKFEGGGGCSHEFCTICLKSYLFQRIVVVHHSLHPCPKFGEEGCRATASIEDVRRIARADVYEEHIRRLKGNCGACEECGHRGKRRSSPEAPPSPPSPPPHSRSTRGEAAAATAAEDEHSTCQSCGSSLRRHHHLHLPHPHHHLHLPHPHHHLHLPHPHRNHHHHHHHHQNDHDHHEQRQMYVKNNRPTAGVVGKSTRRWSPLRAAAAPESAGSARATGVDKRLRRPPQARGGQPWSVAAAFSTPQVDRREAELAGAPRESPRWWSPLGWWRKARTGRRKSSRR